MVGNLLKPAYPVTVWNRTLRCALFVAQGQTGRYTGQAARADVIYALQRRFGG
jgi:hypothetical protein